MSTRTGVPHRTLRLLLTVFTSCLVALVLSGGAGRAAAQPPAPATEPADGAELGSPPAELVLTFEEAIGERNVVAASCNGDPFTQLGDETVSADGLTLSVAVLQPMPEGECNVSWTVTRPTGEAGDSGSFEFAISASTVTTPATTVPGDTTPPTTGPADVTGDSTPSDPILEAADVSDGATWLGQLLSTFGLAVLFGSFVLIVSSWPEGPEYILAVRFIRSMWILAVAGTLLYVVALSAAVREESFGKGLNPAGWLDLFDAGLGGQAALARLVLVVASGWVVMRPERVIDPTTQLPAIAIPALAVVTLGLTRTGGSLVVLGVAAGVAHALAMAVWVGGLVLLARVVLAGPGEEDLVHAVRGFGRISAPAIVVTVVSGLVQLYRLDGGTLFSESHGRVLLLKTLLVAVMLFVGLTARQVAQSRLVGAAELAPGMADRLRRAFGTEALLGVVVIGLSGWLLALSPGKVPNEDVVDYVVDEQIVDPDSGIDLTVSLRPAKVGLNELRVEVVAPVTGLAGLEVTFVPPTGSEQQLISQPIPLSGAGIAVTTAGGGIPLGVAGAWTFQVSAATPTGSITEIPTNFEVRLADGSLPTDDIGTTPTVPGLTQAPTTTVPATATTEG